MAIETFPAWLQAVNAVTIWTPSSTAEMLAALNRQVLEPTNPTNPTLPREASPRASCTGGNEALISGCRYKPNEALVNAINAGNKVVGIKAWCYGQTGSTEGQALNIILPVQTNVAAEQKSEPFISNKNEGRWTALTITKAVSEKFNTVAKLEELKINFQHQTAREGFMTETYLAVETEPVSANPIAMMI